MTADPSTTSTELLIVPTPHLTEQTPDSVVAPAHDRLLAWRPDLIAVEALPGDLVVQYEQRGGPFADFAVGGAPLARIGAQLVDAGPEEVWPARRRAVDPSAPTSDRVLAWLAAREPLNALLLPHEHADLPREVSSFLVELASSAGEAVRIGVRLARSLGHETLAHVDDHLVADDPENGPDDRERAFAAQQENVRGLVEALHAPENAERDLWAQWRFHASPETRRVFEQLESAQWVTGHGDIPRTHRVILAQWRARNLAIAARVRASTATVPGGRVVLIIGAGHEMPLRTALGTDQYDLRLVELEELES